MKFDSGSVAKAGVGHVRRRVRATLVLSAAVLWVVNATSIARTWCPPSLPRLALTAMKTARADEALHTGETSSLSSSRDGPGVPADTPTPTSLNFAAFWKFLRPHTIRGTILGSCSMVSRALMDGTGVLDANLLRTAFLGLVALLCGNGYIVGINQIYDVSIDVINKPFLPMAARELTKSQAWFLIAVMGATGLSVAWKCFGSLIGGLYLAGMFLGTIYSVPPLRLKQSSVAAALIIATVRGFFLNFGVYYATRAALGAAFAWSVPTAFITCFITFFAVVIAVTKDLPDVAGDMEHNVETFATRYGVAKVSTAAFVALLLNYASVFVWATAAPGAFRPAFVVGHTMLAALLARGFVRLRASGFAQDAILAFYRLIWLLLYCEYLFFPFI